MKPYLLQNGELKELFAKIPGWGIKSNFIEREFYFSNFIGAHNYAYTPEEIKLFYNFYNEIMKFWKERLINIILDIKYEDLITNPKKEIMRIFEFLDLDYDENCLLPHKNERLVRTRSKFQIREKINKKGMDKYTYYRDYIPELFN